MGAGGGQTRRYELGAGTSCALELRRVLVGGRRDVGLDAAVPECRVGKVRETMRAHASGGLEVVSPIGRGDRRPRGRGAEQVIAGTILDRPDLGHPVAGLPQLRLIELSTAGGVGP